MIFISHIIHDLCLACLHDNQDQTNLVASSMLLMMASSSNKYRFLSDPDDELKCPICLEVSEEPWQHGRCGRLFCKQCLEKYGRGKPCPHCMERRPDYFEDTKSKLTIYVAPLKKKCTIQGLSFILTGGSQPLLKHWQGCLHHRKTI